jgi:ribosomal protein S18 acetylase RimI-like enzyme
MSFDAAGATWTARVHDAHQSFRIDGVRSPAGAVICPPAQGLPEGAVRELVETIDRHGLGPAVITLNEPVSVEGARALSAHGFVERARWVEVERALIALPPEEPRFELGPFFDDLPRALPLLCELARGQALLADARPEDVLAHFMALGGPDTSGWTVAYREGQPVGLFLLGPPEEGTLWLIGVAPAARGRGWGTCLHRLALAALRERGASRYRDATPESHRAMRRIFERNGCAEVGRFVEWVRPGTVHARPPPAPDPVTGAAAARALARVLFAALLEHSQGQSEPLLVLDPRPGSGLRAARVLQQLDRLLASHPRVLRPLRYVLCTHGDLDEMPWAEVQGLDAWLRAGRLDSASFDPRTDRALELNSGQRLVPDGESPVLVLACEHLCRLPQDAWAIEEDGPRRLQGPPDVPELYEELGLSLVLWSHASKLTGCELLLPVGAAVWLEAAATWAQGRLVVLAVDPGTRTLPELQGRRLASLPQGGSLPVDYAALSLVISARGGQVLLGPGGDGKTVVASIVYGETASVALTLLAWRQAFLEACPLRHNLVGPPSEGPLVDLLAQLTLSADDPELFFALADPLRAHLPEASAVERQAVAAAARRVAALASWRRDAPDVHFVLGQVLHALRLPAEADAALLQSEQLHGVTVASRMNRGLCRWAMGDRAGAGVLFEEVLARVPGEPQALACLAAMRRETGQSSG